MTQQSQNLAELFQTLVDIVAQLRGPHGCPWDKEQTQRSLTQYHIEEAFELVEAIESDNQQEIKEELGDFLFQVILQAQVAKDENKFDINQVLATLNEKMIRRHPHVFGNVVAENSEQVWKNWEKLKAAEKASKPKPIFSYPRSMPALQASYKIGVKTEGYKFDWPNASDVLEKVREEFHETEEALENFLKKGGVSKPVTQSIELAANTSAGSELSEELKALQHEIGDLLFSASQLARHLHLEPEQCLREANRRFEARFNKVLEIAGQKHGADFKSKDSFSTLSLSEKESLWVEAKKFF